jgi:hypothetical protein
MALAVVYAWSMIAWGANWLDPDRPPVRCLLVGLMFASLLMSVAIADAFDGRGWLFVTGYLVIQLGRSTFLIVALRGRALGEHFVNDLVWELAAGALWVAGAIADRDARLVLWGLAVAVAYAGVSTCTGSPGVAGAQTSGTRRSQASISSSDSASSSSSRWARRCSRWAPRSPTSRSRWSACSPWRSASRGPSRSGGTTSSAPRASPSR